MKRTTLLLLILAVVLVLVLWWMFVFTPRADELDRVEDEIAAVEQQQAATRSRIAQLEAVRDAAPQLQADLAAAESLLPRDTALPSALRQLQQAADDSGATLVSVAPSRPDPVEGSDGLYVMNLNAEVRGSYFQIVDVLRRLEDPAISPRGILWDNAALNLDEYPELTSVLAGRMFAVLPQPPASEPEPDPEVDADDDVDIDVEDDADVDVDVEVEP